MADVGHVADPIVAGAFGVVEEHVPCGGEPLELHVRVRILVDVGMDVLDALTIPLTYGRGVGLGPHPEHAVERRTHSPLSSFER